MDHKRGIVVDVESFDTILPSAMRRGLFVGGSRG